MIAELAARPRPRDRRSPRRSPRAAARQRHRPAGLARHRAGVRPARRPGGDPRHERPRPARRRQRRASTARKRTFAVRLACQGDGTLRVRAARLAATDLDRARYRCAAGRATARLKLTSKVAKRLDPPPHVRAPRSSGSAGRDARVSLPAHGGPAARGAEGLLDRRPPRLRDRLPRRARLHRRGARSRSPPAAGSPGTRRRPAGTGSAARARTPGAGTRGRRRSSGVQQFHPNGTAVPVPWTLGPIAVPAGSRHYAAACSRSSTGSAGALTTSGSTSTRARPARSPRVAPTPTACTR